MVGDAHWALAWSLEQMKNGLAVLLELMSVQRTVWSSFLLEACTLIETI